MRGLQVRCVLGAGGRRTKRGAALQPRDKKGTEMERVYAEGKPR
jgi:hypothetical protein